ncbi:uncharacterized protein Tco025E_02709 [Trypanosoma conorhini]|uniref:Uncharacterized protein n=1 Tax=Trypanosoma conorhini TaxID=83891 RepID=A0A422Q1G4_9TRYP|nr:uncharacterized protein Tco025E_02709 [Trypanosoma conorhini]RNF23808.1 hypothetical protein Tco025E_02709 [Trypanosoma conorhini]
MISFFKKKRKTSAAAAASSGTKVSESIATETMPRHPSHGSSGQLTPPGTGTSSPSPVETQTTLAATTPPASVKSKSALPPAQQGAAMHPAGVLPPPRSMSRSQTPELLHSAPLSQRGSASSHLLQPHGNQPQLPSGMRLMSGSPAHPGAKMMMMKGPPLPPGAKLIKGPPPPGMMKKKMMPGAPPVKMLMVPPPPSSSMASASKSPMVPPPQGGLPPRKSAAPAPPLGVGQLGTSTAVSSQPPSSPPVPRSSSASLEKGRAIPPPIPEEEGKETPPSSSKPKLNDVDESKLRPEAPRNLTDSDSELHFVLEEGSSVERTPAVEGSPERNLHGLSNGSSLQFNEEVAPSPTLFLVQNDDATAARGGSVSHQGSQAFLGSVPNSSRSISRGEGKRLESHETHHEETNSHNSVNHRASAGSTELVGKIPETPINQRNRKRVPASDTASDISPGVLEHTKSQKRDKGTKALRSSSLSGLSGEENAMAVSEEKLSPSLRSRIVEQFLSILSPQQFYGKVTKLHGIRLMKGKPEGASGLKEYKTIFVATKGVLPNQFFYPQLRLLESDGTPASYDESPEYLDTPIVLYEAAPGNMLFAETVLEAKHILETNSAATSCFVLENSAIVFKDPLKFALPLAMLTVRWVPYSVAQSEPQCPVHHKELQLFDRFSKGLLCALCVSKNASHAEDLVVIPEVLDGNSRLRILGRLSEQMQERQQSAARWVNQHQRLVSIAKHKKDAVNQQFDLLLTAIKAKREEFLEYCDVAFGYSMSSVAKEILAEDEHVRLLKAAIDHLRTEGAKPLYSMQIATVANALHASEEFPKPISLESLELSALGSELSPNLQSVMAEVQSLSPVLASTKLHCPRSPFSTLAGEERELLQEAHRQEHQQDRRGRSQVARRSAELEDLSPIRAPRPRPSQERSQRRMGSISRRCGMSRESPRQRPIPLLLRDQSMSFDVDGVRAPLRRRRPGQWVTIPGCRGTCLLDVPIHELVADDDDVRGARRKPKCLEWALRVDDPGEWVGIGVGVGAGLKAWAASRTPDLSHLWVVTLGNTRRVFLLRVTVNPNVGHAKLSIHDGKGKRLDDGRIPQWNATRSCYPQVTFGGRIGEVHLVEGPRVV